MFFRTISFIYAVIFVLNYFIKIPYFYLIYLLLTIALVFLHLKEVNSFEQQFENQKFEFYIRPYENNLILKYLVTFFEMVIVAVIIYFIPFKIREMTNIDYLYIFIISLVVTLINWKRKYNYEYYYFGEEFIRKPGKKTSKIYWNEVKQIFENEKDELIIVELHNGSNIKIGTEPYYSFWKKKSEILTYIQNKIK